MCRSHCDRFTCALLAVLVAAVTPASGQQLVYGIGSNFARLDLATGTTTPLSADEAQLGAVVTSDGRIAVRPLPWWSGLAIRDLTTGQQVTVGTLGFTPLLAHPRRLALFGILRGSPARLDARGEVAFGGLCPVPGGSPAIDLSIDGGSLFVLCGGTLFTIDSDTGVEQRRLPMAEIGGPFAVNADATEVVGWSANAPQGELVRVDLMTGAVLQRRSPPPADTPAGVVPTPARDRMIATSCRLVSVNLLCTATLIDAVSLADIRSLGSSNGSGPTVDVSPDGRDAFVSGFGYSLVESFAQWIDVATGAIRASVRLARAEGLVAIDYRAAPLAPLLNAPQVTAGTVTLSWQLPLASPMVTGYVIDAGLAAGTTAVTLPLGPGTTATFPGVPPGRYFVRVRALNVNGTSRPSAEVVVDVP